MLRVTPPGLSFQLSEENLKAIGNTVLISNSSISLYNRKMHVLATAYLSYVSMREQAYINKIVDILILDALTFD